MQQQNLSCWWKRLQSLEFQNPVIAGWVSLVTFVLASFLDYISLLLSLPIFSSKKVTSLATEKKCDSGNDFHFPIPDPHGLHILPQMAKWPSLPPQHYLLTLGFRNKHIGKTLERWSSRKLPIFSGTPTCLIAVIAQGWPPWSLLNEGVRRVSRDPFLCASSPDGPDSSPHPPLSFYSLPIILLDPLWKMYMNKHSIWFCDFIS